MRVERIDKAIKTRRIQYAVLYWITIARARVIGNNFDLNLTGY